MLRTAFSEHSTSRPRRPDGIEWYSSTSEPCACRVLSVIFDVRAVRMPRAQEQSSDASQWSHSRIRFVCQHFFPSLTVLRTVNFPCRRAPAVECILVASNAFLYTAAAREDLKLCAGPGPRKLRTQILGAQRCTGPGSRGVLAPTQWVGRSTCVVLRGGSQAVVPCSAPGPPTVGQFHVKRRGI